VDVRYGIRKRPLERPRCRWEDTIKMDLQGNLEGDVDWIHVSCCSSCRWGENMSLNCFHQWAPLFILPRWYMSSQNHSGMMLAGENWRTQRNTCPIAILPTPNPTWADPGVHPVLHGERPTTDYLIDGTFLSCHLQ
jgi:hypothetical protein